MNEESRKIIEKLRSLKPVLEKEMGIKHLRVFGSVARGEARPDSDIDLIADFDPLPQGWSFFTIDEKIGDLVGGRKIDLFTEDSIDKYIKKRVLREAQHVY